MLRAALGLLALAAGVALLSGALRPRGRWALRGPLRAGGASATLAAAAAGALATLAVQSSSLVIIGLLAAADAETLPLPAVFAAVVGANVGTAMVPQLLSWQPPLALVGLLALPVAALWLWPRAARLGRALAGALSIYAGLDLIASAVQAAAPGILTAVGVHAPLAAYAAGAASTAVLFSSTLTVGTAERLAQAGVVPLAAALAFVLGANVGTTADVLVAAGPCRGRGRMTALFHLLFNLLGSLAALPLVALAARLLDAAAVPPAAAVAHFHAAFNAAAALVALPLAGPLARWAGARASTLRP